MPLNLPDGTACFVDANILYYHFVETAPLSEPSTLFLERAAAAKITAFTSIHVLAEALHKIMLAEAAAKFGLNRSGLVNWLQNHRTRIKELSEFRQAGSEMRRMRLSFVPMDDTIIESAAQLAKELGLLTNDALVISLVKRRGLSDLVTNDDDFDGIPGLTVWKPR
jgi:predicted nucleic acid-binding protein